MRLRLVILGVLLGRLVLIFGAEPWTLERTLQEGLLHNPDARLAHQRILAAQAALAQADSAFWPKALVQSSYTRTDNPMQVFGSILNQRAYSSSLDFNHVPDVDDLNVRGVLTVPLYVGGRNQAGRKAAKSSAEAARLDDKAVRNALAFEIVQTFHTILKSRQFIRAAEAGVNAFEENLAVAKRRLESGSILKTEVLDIEVRLAQAREDLIRIRNGTTLSERALRNLVGIESGEFSVVDKAPEVTVPEVNGPTERSELAAAQLRAQSAKDLVRGAKAGYLPRISAFGSLDYDYGWKFSKDGRSYTGGALLQWDIWDGLLTRSKVQEARAKLEMAQEEERKIRLAVDFEVEQARLDISTAKERLRVTEQVVAQASESAAITKSRFEHGMALSTQLIDTETALIGARVRRAQAEADYHIAIAALRKARGVSQLEGPLQQSK